MWEIKVRIRENEGKRKAQTKLLRAVCAYLYVIMVRRSQRATAC